MAYRGRAMMAALIAGWAVAAIAQEPPPAPAGMIFFDWGKPAIGGDAARTLDEVAAAARARPEARLVVTGHTDRSGGAAHNRRAGAARAATVRGELVRRGVPAAAITALSAGEEQPLVPTEDGVREVQNRRVDIRFAP